MPETFNLYNRSETSNQDVMILNPTLTVTGTVATELPVYTMKMDEYNPTTSYIGEAAVGSGDDDHVWRIKKMDSTLGLTITWASGTREFDKQWSARLSYVYS